MVFFQSAFVWEAQPLSGQSPLWGLGAKHRCGQVHAAKAFVCHTKGDVQKSEAAQFGGSPRYATASRSRRTLHRFIPRPAGRKIINFTCTRFI